MRRCYKGECLLIVSNYFFSAVVVNGCLYWFTRDAGDFVKYNIKENSFSYVAPVNGFKNSNMIFSEAVLAENNIIFAFTNSGKYLLKYNCENNMTNFLQINRPYAALDWTAKVVKYEDYLVILPLRYNKIVYVNVQTGEVCEFEIFDKNVIKNLSLETENIYFPYITLAKCFVKMRDLHLSVNAQMN